MDSRSPGAEHESDKVEQQVDANSHREEDEGDMYGEVGQGRGRPEEGIAYSNHSALATRSLHQKVKVSEIRPGDVAHATSD